MGMPQVSLLRPGCSACEHRDFSVAYIVDCRLDRQLLLFLQARLKPVKLRATQTLADWHFAGWRS
jgi:hypothetical protein